MSCAKHTFVIKFRYYYINKGLILHLFYTVDDRRIWYF